MKTSVLSALLITAWMLIPVHGAEPVLEQANGTNPALIGLLGTPGPGSYLRGTPVWHRSGQIFALEPRAAGLHRLSIWKPDPKTFRAARTAMFNVGESWCVSQRADLLCSQSPRKDDEALDPATNRMAWMPGAFGCFRVQDGKRLWKLPIRENEYVTGAAFTLDDKMVLVLSVWSNQKSLRLLDAATGLLVRQHDFEGRASGSEFQSWRLMMRADEVWMQDKEEDKTVLLRLPLSTLQPVKVNCPPLEELTGRVSLALDGRHILVEWEGGVTCLGLNNGKWSTVYEDHDYSPVVEGRSFSDPLHSALFTPDGRSIVLVSDDSARVTDLASKKTRRIKLDLCRGGTLSPDGGHLLVEYEQGLEIISLRETDVTNPARYRQSVRLPHLLRFSKDGGTLFCNDSEGVWVWDMATRKPRAWLKSQHHHSSIDSTFDTLALVANETQALAEEHDNYLRWKLPALSGPPPETPLIVNPELAFGGVSSAQLGDWSYSGVFVDPAEKWFITANSLSQIVIRRGLGAGISRGVRDKTPPVSSQHWFFGPDDSFTFFGETSSAWMRLDLQQGTVAELSTVRYEPIAVLPRRQFVISEGNARIWTSSVDGKTKLPDFEKPARSYSPGLNINAAVSVDEKRCAWIMKDDVRQRQVLFVWEIETGKLLGQTPMMTNDVTCLAIQPGGTMVACGHQNTAISLWDVSKLTPLPAPAATPATAPPRRATTPAPNAPPPSATVRREHPFGSGLWDFRENGTVTKGASLPEAGQLRVDSAPFESKAHQLTPPYDLNHFQRAQLDFDAATRPNPGDPKFRQLHSRQYVAVAAGLIQISEGQAGEVWVSRQVGNPAGSGGAFLTFTDGLTLLGNEEKNVVVEFDVQFPALTKTFIDSTFKPVVIEPDGVLKVAEDAVWIAALPEKGAASTVPVFMFRSASGSRTERLRWQPETSTLTVRHAVALVPGEARYVMHGLRLVTLKDGASPAQITVLPVTDYGILTLESVRRHGVNFGPTNEHDTNIPPDKPNSRRLADEFGAQWEIDVGGSLNNDTTTSSAHQLWIEGAPLPFSSPGMFVFRDMSWASQQTMPFFSIVNGSSLDKQVTVTRSILRSEEQGLPRIIDRFINQTDQPVVAHLAYVSTFTEPVKALYDASGKPVQPAAAAVAGATLGGSLVVEFSGPTRPATALSFYQDGAAVEPKVSWPSARLLKIEYEVTLPPKKSVQFWHGATQRDLASFSTVAEAFTGVLPFKRNPVIQQEGLMNVK